MLLRELFINQKRQPIMWNMIKRQRATQAIPAGTQLQAKTRRLWLFRKRLADAAKRSS
jgi:hypothetical protein